MHMLSNKSQTFQGSKRKGASCPLTTPCTVVKLNRFILHVRQHENDKKWVGGGMIVDYTKNS